MALGMRYLLTSETLAEAVTNANVSAKVLSSRTAWGYPNCVPEPVLHALEMASHCLSAQRA